MGNEDFNLDLQNEDSEEFVVDFGEVIETGEGGGGTSNFNELTNRPKYNNQTMTGSTNIPKVPTKTSELTNDADFQTWSEVDGAINTAIGGLSIPTKTSDLTNDGSDGTSTYVEADELATVATSGSYNDLNNKPTIPDAQIQSDWTQSDNTKVDYIKNKPTIPTVNDATLTITQNGTSKGTFTANDADDTTIEVSDTTYSNFTGTDGTAAGVAGLVPAPATTDAGKFLKADGTWDSAGGGGPTVVQTTGTSTTDVMSQNATTSMIFADPSTQYKIKIGAGTSSSEGGHAVEIGHNAAATTTSSVAVGHNATVSGNYGTALGTGATAGTVYNYGCVSIGASASATGKASVAIGQGASATVQGQFDIGGINNNAYNSTNYRLLTGLYDPQSAHDAANKGYVDSIVVNYATLTAAGAPTTSTAAVSVGQLYYDSTNDDYYYCSAIDTTDPQNPSYTWSALSTGGGGGPTVVQTTGTSTTDVMSQNAVTSMVFADPSTTQKVNIGGSIDSSSAYGTAVGYQSSVVGGANRAVAIGYRASANASGSVAIGTGAAAVNTGEVNIGSLASTSYGYNNSKYRLLTGVYDGQSAHDAVTVGQINATIDAINTALSTNIPHIGAST